MRPTSALFATFLVLAACTPEDGAEAETGADKDSAQAVEPGPCGPEVYADLIGRSREALTGRPLPDRTRVIGPDQAVTMDYLPDRLNIVYDEDDAITRVYCG